MNAEESRRGHAYGLGAARLVALALRLGDGLSSSARTRELRRFGEDLVESVVRVTRGFRVPTRTDLVKFAGNQLLVNAVAWTAAILSTTLVQRFFEEKSLRNLWGLLPPNDRSLLDPADFETLTIATSYAVGLLILVFVRHLVLRILTELRLVRRARAETEGAVGTDHEAVRPGRREEARGFVARPTAGRADPGSPGGARSTELAVGDCLED